MIILTQDRRRALNLDNVFDFGLEPGRMVDRRYQITATNDAGSEHVILGMYSGEEKAITVLENILKRYENEYQNQPRVYAMPSDMVDDCSLTPLNKANLHDN